MATRDAEGPYTSARRVVALGLATVLGALLLWDAWSSVYDVSPVILGGLLGAVAVLLGVDLGDRIRIPTGGSRDDDPAA